MHFMRQRRTHGYCQTLVVVLSLAEPKELTAKGKSKSINSISIWHALYLPLVADRNWSSRVMRHTQSVKMTYVGLDGADSNRLAMNSRGDRWSKAQLPLAQPPSPRRQHLRHRHRPLAAEAIQGQVDDGGDEQGDGLGEDQAAGHGQA